MIQFICFSLGARPVVYKGKGGVTKPRPWPLVYDNSDSRLTVPHNAFPSRALAREFLTFDAGVTLSRGTSSQDIQTPRPRHSGTTLSLWISPF
eukprot:414978-Pyramimonas_sp.AAC.1